MPEAITTKWCFKNKLRNNFTKFPGGFVQATHNQEQGNMLQEDSVIKVTLLRQTQVFTESCGVERLQAFKVSNFL